MHWIQAKSVPARTWCEPFGARSFAMPSTRTETTVPTVRPTIGRRAFTGLATAALLPSWSVSALAADDAPITRAIPSSGERLPVVGLGTASVFDGDGPGTRAAAAQVVQALLAAGGRLVDTASTYGDAEAVLGAVVAEGNFRERMFIATKLEQPDAAELRRSLSRLRVQRVDLLQLHNVDDPKQSLARLEEWKAQGLCRYIGITSTYRRALPAIEAVLARERPDFVQVDYSIDNREAEARVLPLAAEHKVAVLTALPFGRARLFRAVQGKPVPDWAAPFAASWAQFFLKYLLGDVRVTAVIPGTSSAAHMSDNLGAMRGRLPDAAERQRMAAFVDSL
jgi:aryl-alcohol dehydrogenase-like predicted oxidoreductase